MPSLLEKNIFSLLSVATFVAVFAISDKSTAAQIEISIATDYAIDAETGAKSPLAINLSGTANIAYTNSGLILGFNGKKGDTQEFKIHLDFDSLLNGDPSNRQVATAIFDKITQLGPATIGKVITQIAERAKASGQTVTLMFDSNKSPGFFKTDFDLNQVRIVTSGGENVRLQTLIARLFMPADNEPQTTKSESEGQGKIGSQCEGTFIAVSN